MRYLYTVVFSFHGIQLRDGHEHLLIEDSDSGLRAILTLDPNPYLSHADRSNAIASMILRGTFGGALPTGNFNERLATLVEEAREARGRQFGQGSFIVITFEGDALVGEPRAERETEEFVFWLDGGNKREIQVQHESRVTAALNSVILYDAKIAGIRPVGDSVTYFREDGKPIYARRFEMGQSTVYVSSPIPDNASTSIQGVYNGVVINEDLTSVLRLSRRSFEFEEDRFLAFLSAWLALEILIHKLHKLFRGDKERRSVIERFEEVACRLDKSADADVEALKQIKKQRDAIVHGEEFIESDLLLAQARTLARRYLLLHINASTS